MSHNNQRVKEVFFNPDLKFENLNYNIEKNNNSIMQEMDINLDGFENELDMNGGSDIDNTNQLSYQNTEKMNEQFNTISLLDPTLNQIGSGNKNYQPIQI